jgi:hypothetical protein
MRPALAYFVSVLFVGAVLVGAAGWMTCQLEPEARRQPLLRWLASWFGKGLIIPLALWMVMNLGISWNLQPFMPQIQAAQNSGASWLPAYLRVVANGLFIASSYWAAVTLGWALYFAYRRAAGDELANFRSLAFTCLCGMLIPALIALLLGGLPFAGLAAALILAPLAGYAPETIRPPKTPPMYARAVARMKFGKYGEAEWEILKELEKSEDDFEGWMMLADLYASHFNDLREAERTILEICDQPRTTPSELAVALHRLADWHLKIAGDPVAARRALGLIRTRLPGTHLAHMAELRSRQLPLTAAELAEQRVAKPIPLPPLGDTLDERPVENASPDDQTTALEMAKACVKQLELDPNHVAAREKLARLLAERLDQVERGLEQLSLLLNMPDQSESKKAEWLSLTAAWHIKYRQDPAAGHRILERLVREYPDTPQAFAAQRRLKLDERRNRNNSIPTDRISHKGC